MQTINIYNIIHLVIIHVAGHVIQSEISEHQVACEQCTISSNYYYTLHIQRSGLSVYSLVCNYITTSKTLLMRCNQTVTCPDHVIVIDYTLYIACIMLNIVWSVMAANLQKLIEVYKFGCGFILMSIIEKTAEGNSYRCARHATWHGMAQNLYPHIKVVETCVQA